MRIYALLIVALAALAGGIALCGGAEPPAPERPAALVANLRVARNGFHTKLTRQEHEDEAVAEPPPELFRVVHYESPAGKLAAYLSVAPKDAAKHPAMIWIFGGFDNSIGETAWQPAEAKNDQSARAFREAGMVMMYPSFRGGNKNPGFKEAFYGEVDDVLAAAEFLSKQPFIDPKRIYLGGHSTGGTMALLAAEMSDQFRAVISFGPVASVAGYGSDSLPFDTRSRPEIAVRSPAPWLGGIRTPVFVFEGDTGTSNIKSLKALEKVSKNPQVHFHPVPGLSHFSVLAPATKLIAAKLKADTGDTVNVSFSAEELAGLAAGK